MSSFYVWTVKTLIKQVVGFGKGNWVTLLAWPFRLISDCFGGSLQLLSTGEKTERRWSHFCVAHKWVIQTLTVTLIWFWNRMLRPFRRGEKWRSLDVIHAIFFLILTQQFVAAVPLLLWLMLQIALDDSDCGGLLNLHILLMLVWAAQIIKASF